MRNSRRVLHLRDLDELLGDQRAAERGGQRIPFFVHRAGLERRQNVIAREFLPHVEHVASDGAGADRPLANLVQLAALAKIHGDRDDLGVVLLLQPGNGDRGIEPA